MKTNNNEEEFYKLYYREESTTRCRKNFNKDKIDEYIEICKQKTPRNAKDYYIIKSFNVWSNNEGEHFLINNNNNNIDTPPPVMIKYINLLNKLMKELSILALKEHTQKFGKWQIT